MKMGGHFESFYGLSGIGDLIVTCASMHSRNRRAGILIGQGKTYEEINQQWYDTHYWTDMHAQADELDKLINEFNDATGVLANM